jgi:hypothetical protein
MLGLLNFIISQTLSQADLFDMLHFIVPVDSKALKHESIIMSNQV